MSRMRRTVAALLPLLVFLKEVSAEKGLCPCDEDGFEDTVKGARRLLEIFISTNHREIHCCAKGLLDSSETYHNITWNLNGQPSPWKSSLAVMNHCPETLVTKYATPKDAGNYTCTITTVNKTLVRRTYDLRVMASGSYKERPILSHISDDILTLPGKDVTLTCRGYFGSSSGFGATIFWKRDFDNGSFIFISDMANAKENKTNEKNGMFVSRLHLTELKMSDYGRYVCVLKNRYGNSDNNVTIIYGLPHHEHMAVTFRAWLLVVVFVFMFLVTILCVWCRCRTVLLLYYKENFAPPPPKGDYKWDVMVVHSEDSASWVWNFLVPRLEDNHGYSCFLPERDLCGGQMVAETVAEIVGQCGRVVLVVTKGLLESPTAVWALHQSVHAVLTTKAKMIAVIIEDITKVKSPDTSGLVTMLKVVRKIHWPGPWTPETDDNDVDEEVFEEDDMVGKEEPKGKKEKKKNKKKKKRNDKKTKNNNNSNQKVSNMVSGHNKNLEALDELDKVENGKPLRPTRLYIDLHEQASTSEPGSPDSQAPFIMPSVSYESRDKVGCWELVKTGYALDPIELFWQKLRLYLLRPMRARNVQHGP
ncbi:interleukin-1 receptor accessory protein-like 1-B [Oratosquilla oratoria]|uniref:interleukin-1 receptor accessory protein-like 1-B n=1 Tax=Oratosquilla oratoria TaxID=337810 RepID=UPI003F76EC42